jgi:hypothetical protein
MYKFTKFTYVLFVGRNKNYILLHMYGYLYSVELSYNFKKNAVSNSVYCDIGYAYRLHTCLPYMVIRHPYRLYHEDDRFINLLCFVTLDINAWPYIKH